jgi:hypothetical protein
MRIPVNQVAGQDEEDRHTDPATGVDPGVKRHDACDRHATDPVEHVDPSRWVLNRQASRGGLLSLSVPVLHSQRSYDSPRRSISRRERILMAAV